MNDTSATHLDLDAMATSAAPLTFTAGGRMFHAAGHCPVGLYADLLSSAKATPADQLSASLTFIGSLLSDEEQEVFGAMCHDTAVTLTTGMIGRLLRFLTDRYNLEDVPLERSVTPSNGLTAAGSTLQDWELPLRT